MIDALIQFGPFGMFLAAFLAGSFFPFSSEAVMLALLAMGLNPWELMLYGTAGNVLGSVFNYCVGRLGKEEWFEKYLHVKPEHMERARRFMRGTHGILCIHSYSRFSNNDTAWTDESQHRSDIRLHYSRKTTQIYTAYIWCLFGKLAYRNDVRIASQAYLTQQLK